MTTWLYYKRKLKEEKCDNLIEGTKYLQAPMGVASVVVKLRFLHRLNYCSGHGTIIQFQSCDHATVILVTIGPAVWLEIGFGFGILPPPLPPSYRSYHYEYANIENNFAIVPFHLLAIKSVLFTSFCQILQRLWYFRQRFEKVNCIRFDAEPLTKLHQLRLGPSMLENAWVGWAGKVGEEAGNWN